MPDQKTMWTRCLGGFSVMWVTKLLISPVKKGFFAQKRPNLAWNWHFWPLLAHLVPCWWVGWWLWRAGCISQDTYLLYLYFLLYLWLQCHRRRHADYQVRVGRWKVALGVRSHSALLWFGRCNVFGRACVQAALVCNILGSLNNAWGQVAFCFS